MILYLAGRLISKLVKSGHHIEEGEKNRGRQRVVVGSSHCRCFPVVLLVFITIIIITISYFTVDKKVFLQRRVNERVYERWITPG